MSSQMKLRTERLVRSGNRVEDQQFARVSRDGEPLGFSASEQARVEGLDHRVVSIGDLCAMNSLPPLSNDLFLKVKGVHHARPDHDHDDQHQRGLHILVVDDNHDAAKRLTSMNGGLVQTFPRCDFDQKQASPAGALRLLFGAPRSRAVGAMSEDKTEIRNAEDLGPARRVER